jgi:hypothetical protein
MKKNMLATAVALVVTSLFQNAMGLSLKKWTAASNSNWSVAANWSPSAVPNSSDSVVFDGTGAGNCNLDVAGTVGAIVFTAANSAENFTFAAETLTVMNDIDFTNYGNFNAGGWGAIKFNGAGTQHFYPHAGATFPNIIQSGAGNVMVMGDLMTKDILIQSGTFNLSTYKLLVQVNNFGINMTAGTFDASASSDTIQINGDLTISLGATFKSTSGILRILGNFTNNNGFLHDNGTVEMIATIAKSVNPGVSGFYNLTFGGAGGTWTSVPSNITVLNNLTISNGTFTAPTSYLYVGGSWNGTGGTFNHNNGIVKFSNNAGGSFTVDRGTNAMGVSEFHSVQFKDTVTAGTWTITGHGMVARDVGLFANTTLNLGAGLVDSVWYNMVFSGGTLDFGSSTLKVPDWCCLIDFSAIGSLVPGSGKLEFCGLTTQTFKPKTGATFPEIVQNSIGATTVLNGPLDAAGITCRNGTFQFNATRLGNNIGFLSGTGGTGTIFFNGDSVNVADTANLSNVNVNPGTGILRFVNNSPKTFVPKNGGPNPRLIKAGAGTTTVGVNYLVCPRLDLESGTFALAPGGIFAHQVDTLHIIGGGLDFGSCTLAVTCPNVDLSNLSMLTPGTGTLKFTALTLQSFWPSMSYTNPIIKHAGTGTLKLMNTLMANGFEQLHGANTFNLNGYDISIVNGGNFMVDSCSGPNTIVGLGGRTISVEGNVIIIGIPPGTTADLGTVSPWSLHAGGQLLFDCVNFDSCNATGSPGVATNSLNHGGNINWTFVKQWLTGGPSHIWGDAANWGPAQVPSPMDSVVISTNWDCGLSMPNSMVKAITFSGYTGTFSFYMETLTVAGSADFSGATNVDSGSGSIKFIGNGLSTLKGPGWPGCLATIYNQGTGTLTAMNPVRAKNLINLNGTFLFGGPPGHDTLVRGIAINGGTVNLGSSNLIETQALSGTGMLQSGIDTLVVSGNADFSGFSAFYPAMGTVIINSQNMKLGTLIPGYKTFNNLVLWDNGSGPSLDTIAIGAGFFTVNGDLVFRQNNAISAPSTSVWKFDLDNPAVTVNGNVVVENMPAGGSQIANSNLFMGSGTWTFNKNVSLPIGSGTGKNATFVFSGTATQACSTWIASPGDTLGFIQHTSNDTLRVKGIFRCRSFNQTAGTLDLSGDSLAVAGDFSATNSTSGTFASLGGSKIVFGGNATISGSPSSMANLVGGSMYNIYIASGHSLTADWAKIGDCWVNAGAGTGTATNSRKMNMNTYGWSISSINFIWMGSANSSWKNPANWSPAFLPSDSDNVYFDAAGAGHNCQLDTSIGIKDITFGSGYSGTFDFMASTLTLYGNADFTWVNSIANTSGTLRFYGSGSSMQYFTPKSGVPFPKIMLDGGGGPSYTVQVMSNGLTAGGIAMNSGSWNWGASGAIHTVQSVNANSPSSIMDFGNSTVRVQDSVNIGCNIQYSNGARIDLVKGTGAQCIRSQNTLPQIRHETQGTVKIFQQNLTCDSYINDSGSITLNGYNLTTTGDMVFNSGSATFSDLPGRRLTAGGMMALNGRPGDSIIVAGGVPKCTLAVIGPLHASYAVLNNCVASGSIGNAGSSRDGGNNTNWFFVPAGVKKWAAGAGSSYWSTASNWLPAGVPTASDSVVFDGTSTQYCMLDANGTAKALTFATGYNSTFDFSTSTLTVFGSVDFTGCGYVMGYNGTLSFNGNSQNVLVPSPGGSIPSIVRATGNGSLTIMNYPISAYDASISVLSGTLNLGNGLAHSVKTMSGSPGATLNFGTNSSLTVQGDANLANMTVMASTGDSLIFNGSYGEMFSYPSAQTNLTIVVQKNDTLKLSPNNLLCDQIVMYSGTLSLGTGLSHSANGLQVYGGVLDFGASTLTVSGNIDMSGAQDILPGNGTLTLTAASGSQNFIPQYPDTMPAIVHSGSAALQILANPLICMSLVQSGGPLSFIYLATVNNLTVTNGTSTTFSALDNRIVRSGGDASLTGQGGNLLNLNPASPWSLAVGGTCSIINATIGKCSATGCMHWPALVNCVDAGGNTKFDFIAPTMSVVSPANDRVLISLPAISGTASDAGSGVSQVALSLKRLADNLYWNGALWSAQPKMLPATGTTAWSYPTVGISFSDGGYAIQAQAADSASNAGTMVADSFTTKTTVPTAPVVSIVNNNGSTNAASVQLGLSVVGADSMRFQLNANGWTLWEPYATSKIFSIATGGEGLKKVYAMYEDKAGNVTSFVSDSIMYDITPPQSPTIRIISNNGYTGSATPQITLSATGADSMHFQLNAGVWSAWEPYATLKNNFDISAGGNGAKMVAVIYKDKAGNASTMVHDSVIYDSRLPGVTSVTILDSNGYINTAKPKVQIAAVNADSMRFGLPADTAAALWKAFATLDSITVSTGGDGIKKVFVQVKTIANTRSVWVFDSTVYDATPPQSPVISVIDNNGYTGSATPQISLSAVGADSMQFEVNAQAWTPWLVYAATKSNLDISSGGDGLKRIFARFKDRAYNISATVYDSTVYDTRVPVMTSVTILDSNGYINARRPRVQIAAANADSMRLALSTDSTAAWKKFAQLDSIDISAGAAGLKRVWVQGKTMAGALSPWMADSTVYDTSMPRAAIVTKGSFIAPSWPGMIAGTASDQGSGIKSIYLSIMSKNDTTFWNGGAWTKSSVDLQVARPVSNWAYSLPCPKIGIYQVVCHAVDSAWNVQSPSDSAIITMLKDTLPPAPVTALTATSASVSTMVLSWQPSASADAESLLVCTSVKTRLTGRTAGVWGKEMPASRTVDTLVNLPADGSTLYYDVFVKDTLGNWSLLAPDSVKLRDTVPPPNNCVVTLAGIGDTAIRVCWKIDSTLVGDAVSLWFGYAPFALVPAATPYPYRDTSFIIGNITTPGLWRVSTSVGDAAGNKSPVKFDTITIKPLNTLPVLTSWSLPDTVMQDSMAMGQLVVTDPDAGDSIAVSWSAKPSWVTVVPQPGHAAAGTYSFAIGGKPARSDSGWNRLTFGVSDRSGPASGPAFMVRDSVFVKATLLAPVVVIRKDQTKILGAAAQFVLATQNAGDSGVTFNVTISALDDTTYVKKLTSTSGVVGLFPLADGTYELVATALSAKGLRDTIGMRDTFTIRGATTHQFAGPSQDTTVVSWQMVSFPSQTMTVPSTSELSTLYHWDEKAGERDIYGYYHRVSETGQIQPGFGYWRKPGDTATVKIARGNVLDTTVNITLYKGDMGWNQISSPFPYPVQWPYPGILWQWNDSTHDFEEASGVLNPWQGYWVMADSTMTVRLANSPAFTPPVLAKRNLAKFADTNNWQIRVTLKGQVNTDAQNILGFNADARNGYDACDAAKPPRMSDYQYMFFSHPEWKRGCVEYARDIRRTLNRVEAFTIGISPGSGKKGSEISFEGLSKVTKYAGLYLADEKNIVAVETGKSYEIEKSDKVLYKTLFVTTDKNFLKNFPRTFTLGQPYPNPTRRMANIQYSLPYHLGEAGVVVTDPYKVSIALYDVMGRQIRQLVYTMKEPGNYGTFWDGKNNAGRYVAAGMYFCRLSAGGKFETVKRISVIK